jgi:hypothetical protein
LSVCLSVICLWLRMSVYVHICLSMCMYVCLCVRMSVRVYRCLSMCTYVRLCVFLSMCLSVFLSMCLYVCLSICKNLQSKSNFISKHKCFIFSFNHKFFIKWHRYYKD